MNTKASILKKGIVIVLALILISIVVIKLKTNKEITQNKVYQYDKEQAIRVQGLTVKLQELDDEFSFSGTFEPNKETKLSAESQGKINAFFVELGSMVKKGQTLVQLDNSLLTLQMQTIDVQIEGLEADVNRYSILAKADAIQGVQLEKALLGLKSAKVQRAIAAEQLAKTTIRAPFSGVVTAKLSEVGAFASPGVPLLQITDISTLKFSLNVAESELSKFQLNQSYSIRVDAYSDLSFAGKATMIGSKANMGSSFPIQFTLNNTSDFKIKSGMFGTVATIAGRSMNEKKKMGIRIPASAVVGSGEHPQIYVISKGKSVLRDITISKKEQNYVVVSSGLKVGEVIVSSGFINLFDGANVIAN